MPTVSFSASTSSVNKNAGTKAITVSLSAPAPAGGCSVDWITADGTAQSVTYGLGQDFESDSDTLAFSEGEQNKDITITISNNPVINLDRDFTVTLSNPVNATLGATTVHTCTIVDNARAGILDVKDSDGSLTSHGLEAYTCTGNGSTDETVKLQAIFDYAETNGNGYVIQFPTGTYMVDPHVYTWCLRAYSGDTYRNKPGDTPSIKRITTALTLGDAANLFANDPWLAPESQFPIAIYGMKFDNSGQLTDEQSPCVRFGGGISNSGERWIARIQNCSFYSWVNDIVDGTPGAADAIMTVANTDIDIYDCYSSGCHRGGVDVIEGHSIINVRDFESYQGHLHFETEQGGYGGDRTIVVNVTNCSTDLTFDINPYYGYYTGNFTNISCGALTVRTWPPRHDTVGDWVYDVVNIQDCPDLRTDAASDQGFYYPRGVTFTNCTITATYSVIADNYIGVIWPVYTNFNDPYNPGPPESGNFLPQTGGWMIFNSTTFKTDAGFTTPVVGIGVVADASELYTNKIICQNGCVFHQSLDHAVRVPASAASFGGWLEIHDSTIDVTNGTGFPIYVGGENATGAFHLVLDNVTFGPNTTKYMSFNGTPNADCIIELGGIATLNQSKNVIEGTAYGYTFKTLDGLPGIMRKIVGTSAPTNGSTVGFCSNDETMFDQYHNTTTNLYYKCTSMNPYTWEEYIPGSFYTRGSYTNLPITDADLLTQYTDADISNVATDDSIRVDQTAILQYAVHEFKQVAGVNDLAMSISCDLQTDIAPSNSPVVLEVFDRNSNQWVEVTRDDSSGANTDFTLSFIVNSGSNPTFDNAKDVNRIISCRVWQHAE